MWVLTRMIERELLGGQANSVLAAHHLREIVPSAQSRNIRAPAPRAKSSWNRCCFARFPCRLRRRQLRQNTRSRC